MNFKDLPPNLLKCESFFNLLRHFGGGVDASQFTLSNREIRYFFIFVTQLRCSKATLMTPGTPITLGWKVRQ